MSPIKLHWKDKDVPMANVKVGDAFLVEFSNSQVTPFLRIHAEPTEKNPDKFEALDLHSFKVRTFNPRVHVCKVAADLTIGEVEE